MNIKTIFVLDLKPTAIEMQKQTFKEIFASQYGVDALHGMSSPYSKILSFGSNNLISTLYFAFQYHLGVRITPSMIWLQILHGIGNHINNDPEKWRLRCVSHAGKVELIVFDPKLRRGFDANGWGDVIENFIKKMNNSISISLRDTFQISLSEETIEEKIAFNASLMSTMQHYFEFTCITLCGIPKIEITGTSQDWQTIIEKTEILIKYFEMPQWGDKLIPILKKIKASLDPDFNDVEFWKNIYKHDSMSGGPSIDGWVTDLFPYLNIIDPNDKMQEKLVLVPNWRLLGNQKLIIQDYFPSGISSVPVKWNYLGEDFKMILEAGFMGAIEVEKSILTPFIGWCMRDEIFNKPNETSNDTDWFNYKGFFESGNPSNVNKVNEPAVHSKLNLLRKIKNIFGLK